MFRMLRTPLIASILLALVAWTLAPRAASAAPRAGLDVRKTKYFMDDKGQVWLSVHLVNGGDKPVTIVRLAPSESGPWTNVGQSVAPGETVRGAIKVQDGGIAAVWVDSSQGVLRFDLPQKR